jgi:hypothetical protein
MNFSNIWDYKIMVPPLIHNHKLNKNSIYYNIYSECEYILALLNINCINYIKNIKKIINGYLNNKILNEMYYYLNTINNIFILYNKFIKKISKKNIKILINNNKNLKIYFVKLKYSAVHITNLCYYLINKYFANNYNIYKYYNYFYIKNIIIIIFQIINYFDNDNKILMM